MKNKLPEHQESNFNKIADYYNYLTFEKIQQNGIPSWIIRDKKIAIGTLWYFGGWQIETKEDYWGKDFDSFISVVEDFKE